MQEYPCSHPPALRAVFKLLQLMNNLPPSDLDQTELQHQETCRGAELYVFAPAPRDTLFTFTAQTVAVKTPRALANK